MAPAGEAVATSTTDQVAFTAHQITNGNIGNARTKLNHLAGELMADGHWRFQGLLSPGVPRLNVQIGAADACCFYSHEHVACFDCRNRNVDEL
jgi:hypothetical protein